MSPEQLDWIPRPKLDLRVGNAQEPRLWIRRVAIWSAPRKLVREVKLRPGLNILWSPDPAEGTKKRARGREGIGHTSGKTLFCRLIRYCLGEEGFSNDSQRSRITSVLKEGFVGAEVSVDGTVWSIVRSVGLRRRHVAVEGGNLDALAANTEPQSSEGIEQFLEAVGRVLLTDQVLSLLEPERDHRSWLVALAWLCRDQECRLRDALDWRDASSDSASPIRSMSRPERLEAVRALLGAIREEEQRLTEDIARADAERERIKQELSHRKWAVREGTRALATSLGEDPGRISESPLEVQFLANRARQGLATVALDSDGDDLETLFDEADAATKYASELASELAAAEAELRTRQETRRNAINEKGDASVELSKAEDPVCPLCEVKVDLVLLQGCPLSREPVKLEELRERHARASKAAMDAQAAFVHIKTASAELAPRVEAARKHAEQLKGRARDIGRARAARSRDERDGWLRIQQAVDLTSAIEEETRLEQALATRSADLEVKREQLGEYRGQSAAVFRRVSEIFDCLAREMLGPDARGSVTHDGNGLHLSTSLNGQSTSTGINSLRVLLFDLSIMCLSMEGTGHLPAFLVHDSPREADLGLGIYHRLLQWLRDLERVGPQPLFQYIITTTTAPPKELQCAPWLVATLHASPAKHRLFGTDL